MRRIYWILFFSCLLLTHCSGGSNQSGGGTTSTTLAGLVKDTSGTAVQGVTVSDGTTTTTTASDGSFSLTSTAGTEKIFAFSKSGYAQMSKGIELAGGENVVSIVLAPQQFAATVDASQGGTVAGIRNASVTIPADAFANSSGDAVTGNVDVSLTPFDPFDLEEALAYPGDLRGLDADSTVVRLETFGVLDVTVKQDGSELDLQSGKTLTVTFPAPSSGEKPDTVPVWYFDETTGLWVASDAGDATYDATTDTYVATISHLSPQNLDRPLVPTCLSGLVEDADGNPVAGAHVQAIPSRFGNTSSEITDSDGYYCMYVERDSALTLRIYTPLDENCPEAMRDGNQCITERTVQSGSSAITAGYPADCSASCSRVPNVETGTEGSGSLSVAECNVNQEGGDPFEFTCAADLSDLYACFAPSGACTYWIDPFATSGTLNEITFANGSRIATELSAFTALATNYYGPLGTLCGSFTYSSDGGEITIALPAGQSFIIRTTSTGKQEIVCPSGQTITVNPAQSEVMSTCSGTSDEASSEVQCTAEPGTMGADCTFDSECDSGFSCCNFLSSDDSCQIALLCDLMCESDLECGSTTQICCDAGGYNLCQLPSMCQ